MSDFVDKVLRENASRASAREPPLTYREAKERWADVLEKRAGYGARPAAGAGYARDGGSGASQKGGPAGAKRARAGTQSKGKEAKTAAGEPVCFHFNRKNGCNRAKKGAGCDDGRGGTYAHVCNFETAAGKFCLSQHSRVGNH